MLKSKISCQQCALKSFCLPIGLSDSETQQLNAIIKRGQPLNKGDILYQKGQKLNGIYAVISGSFKTYIEDQQQRHIIGYHLPGELLALDAISSQYYSCTAEALETSTFCELPFDQLSALTAKIPMLQNRVFTLLSKEISSITGKQRVITKINANEALAYFLIDISHRYAQRGFSANDFFLTLSRGELGSYLGLAEETVSRIFSSFQKQGLIKITRRHIEILDMPALKEIIVHIALNQPD